MKRFLSTVVMGSFLAAAFAGNALAFDNTQAGIALHIGQVTTKNACDIAWTPSNPTGIRANLINVQAPLLPQFHYTYLLVCNGSDSTGVAGLECGIDYTGDYAPNGGAFPISVFDWTLCATLEFPSNFWPAPNSGNLITWSAANCQDQATEGTTYTVIGVAGYFYMGVYGDAQMAVIPRPVSGAAKVADCSAAEDDLTFAVPSHLGVVGFGIAGGYNPCGAPTPVQESTWGQIKSLYSK